MKELTKGQKRFLSRARCGWCDIELHKGVCADYAQPCSEKLMKKTREACLKLYKPRKKKAAA